MDIERRERASYELENMIPVIQRVAVELRYGSDGDVAYALLWRLRWELGQVLAHSGKAGVPMAKASFAAKEFVEAQRSAPFGYHMQMP